MEHFELGSQNGTEASVSEINPIHEDDQFPVSDEARSALDEVRSYADVKLRYHNQIRSRFMRILSGADRKDEMDGWIKFMKKIEDGKSIGTMQTDISSFRYGTDRSIARSTSPENVWNTIKRRAAWKKQPLRMLGLTFTQITLCAIVAVSSSSPINSGTVIMAVLFIVATGASNPLKITKDAIGYIEKEAKKIGWPAMIAILCLAFPVTGIVFMVTITLDLVCGEIYDVSYGYMCNVIVRTFVVFTAISVGLRSGNPINAIQTFAGFDFIDGMDELVIDDIDFDFDELARADLERADSSKILFVRLAIYISTPLIIVGFLYITIVNVCYAFCTTGV